MPKRRDDDDVDTSTLEGRQARCRQFLRFYADLEAEGEKILSNGVKLAVTLERIQGNKNLVTNMKKLVPLKDEKGKDIYIEHETKWPETWASKPGTFGKMFRHFQDWVIYIHGELHPKTDMRGANEALGEGEGQDVEKNVPGLVKKIEDAEKGGLAQSSMVPKVATVSPPISRGDADVTKRPQEALPVPGTFPSFDFNTSTKSTAAVPPSAVPPLIIFAGGSSDVVTSKTTCRPLKPFQSILQPTSATPETSKPDKNISKVIKNLLIDDKKSDSGSEAQASAERRARKEKYKKWADEHNARVREKEARLFDKLD